MENEKRLIDTNAKFIEKHFKKQLIDGYALVDVIENIDWYHISPQGKLAGGANSQRNTPLYKAADIHRALANAPIVDAVEVVHGRWIMDKVEIGNPYDGNSTMAVDIGNCSRCGYRCEMLPVMNYCPNCGAKMDEGEEA